MIEEAWMTFMPDGTDDDVWYTNPEGKLPEGYTYQKLNPNWSKEMAQPEQEPLSKIESAAAKAVDYRSEYQKPLTVRLQQLADRYDFFKEEVHRLESALAKRKNEPNELLLRRVMARLADLLDEDQFADIESIVTSVGVSPPQPKEPEQKPVARVVEHGATVKLEWANADAAHNAKVGNLYTTPPQRTWVGLTDEETQQAFASNSVMVDNGNAYMVADLRAINIGQAIEAKLKEKNT